MKGFAVLLFAAFAMLAAPAAASAAPELSVTPPTYTGDPFLDQENVTKTVSVTSVGTSPVTISEIEKGSTGTQNQDFSIPPAFDFCSGTTLQPTEGCTFRVDVDTATTGDKYTFVYIHSDDPFQGGSRQVFIASNVINPVLAVDPASHDFGEVEVLHGTASLRSFTLTSDGTTPLTVPLITFGGDDWADFELHSTPDCGTLIVDASCTVEVDFEPESGAAGVRNATLRIYNNSKVGVVEVPLTGTATKANFTRSPETVHLGSFDLYTAPDLTREVTITSNGTADLEPVATIVDGGKDAWSVDTDDCETAPVPPGETCVYDLNFEPAGATEGDPSEATLNITSNGNTEIVPISGTLLAGAAEPEAANASAGIVEVGQSGTVSVGLESTGTASLIMGSPVITGPDAGMFTLSQTQPNDCDGASPTAHCQVDFDFKPTSPGPKTATVKLSGNFGTLDIVLQGTGAQAAMDAPSEITFADQVGTGGYKTFYLTSTGNVPLRIDGVALGGAHASSFSVEHDPCESLSTGETCRVKVTYLPTTVGKHEAELTVTSNVATKTIRLSGSARALDPPSIKLTGPSSVQAGKTVRLKVKLRNLADALPLGPLTLRTSLPKKLAKTVKPITVAPLAPGKTVTKTIVVKVRKSAKKTGHKHLKVSVTASGESLAKPVKVVKTLKIRRS